MIADVIAMAAPMPRPAGLRSITVLVPALNEAANLGATVETLIRALGETTDEFEIIVVDDGSTDGTAAVADALAAAMPRVRVFHNARNCGIGYAYMLGCREARCSHFVYIPGDNTWPYDSCRQLFAQLGRADIVTSYATNPEVRPLGRRLLSPLYTACLNLIFGRRMRYYNGLNIYPVDFLRGAPVTTFGFGFQAEVLLKALAAGLSYVEIGLPIDERAAGGSKAVRIRNILSVVTTVLRLAWRLRILRQTPPARRGK
jgi:glycosyltransferase involved in cell wall biosynthesis